MTRAVYSTIKIEPSWCKSHYTKTPIKCGAFKALLSNLMSARCHSAAANKAAQHRQQRTLGRAPRTGICSPNPPPGSHSGGQHYQKYHLYEQIMKNFWKATLGCILIPLFHVPRFVYQLLLISYTYVFNSHENLTASPKEHINRARKLLRGQNSQLLYAALELRFALERMAQFELLMSAEASERVLDDPDPVKKVKVLQRINQEAAYEQKIFILDKVTGNRIEWGRYKPLDEARTANIKGRLGDLLHPKDGLSLGIWTDPWYTQTRIFLTGSLDYLSSVIQDNTPFFSVSDLSNFEMVRVEG